MRVYYISNRYDGCWYVRCYLPMLHNGWDGDKISPRSLRADPQRMMQGAMAADVIVFHRPDDRAKLEVLPLLQEAGKKVVFDNDDTYKPGTGVPTIMETLNEQITLQEMDLTLTTFARMSDLVTTTTDWLANEYREVNKNTIVLPNLVDPDDWEKPLRNDGPKVRIGLVGSVLANDDYGPIKEVLGELGKRPDVQLVIFGLPPKRENTKMMQAAYKKEYEFWEKLPIEWQPFVNHAEYNETLNNLKLDIMLIPRQESYFNKAKSNIKFLEAAMCQIPVIASSFPNGPYEELDGTIGIKIAKAEDWMPAILDLVDNQTKRRNMGRDACNYVIGKYNAHTKAHLWEDAYKKLF